MQYFFIKKLLLLSIIILSGCTDILINDDQYNSIHLNGGGWIQFNGEDVADYLNDDFSIQLWISGDTDTSNDAKALISILNDNEIILGLFRDTSIDNIINIYLNNELVGTIQNDGLDWSTSNFNLITLSSNNNIIKVHINKTEEFSSDAFDLELNSSNLIFGAKVNSEQTIATNFWSGYIDEIRLWNKALSDEEISFHIDNPTKLNTSDSGNYLDELLDFLKGLWRFNYTTPQYNITDESCLELDLDSGISGNAGCENINGTIYTLPGYSVEFSTFGI